MLSMEAALPVEPIGLWFTLVLVDTGSARVSAYVLGGKADVH